MSRELRPAELYVCRVVFGILALVIGAFLLLKSLEPQFDHGSGAARKVEVAAAVRTAAADAREELRAPSRSAQQADAPVQNSPPAAAKPATREGVSPSVLKAGLNKIAAVGLERMVRFDPQPLDGGADAQTMAENKPEPILTEPFQSSQEPNITIAVPERPLPASAAPTAASEIAPALIKADAAAPAQALTDEEALQAKSRLHELGYLSVAKSSAWDTAARSALRDFKVANALASDDRWDAATSDKLSSQTAIRANESIIGTWSSAPCRSAKPADTRLSINSRRAKSSSGSTCEFRDIKVAARAWRVKASCSQGDKHWSATGQFSLVGDKLVWTSERDVINYFRCN